MHIFSNIRGVAVAFDERPALPALLRIDGRGPTEGQSAAVTGLSVQRSAIVQMRNTFGGVIHVLPFGEGPGNLAVSGVLFRGRCNALSASVDLGVNQVMDYYNQNSVTTRSAPVSIAIGRQAVSGFLVGVVADMQEDEFGVGRFQFSLLTMPPRRNRRVTP